MPALENRTTHHAALPYAEIYNFMTKLGAIKSVAARAVEFAILCAVRTGEARFAVWDEIDLANRRWNIPGSRTKTGKDLSVPLAPRSIELLKSLPSEAGSNYVFVGIKPGQPLGHSAFQETVKRISNVTMHGFRSCFRDWAAECTSYPNHVCEMALGHAIGNAVEKAYRRGDLFEQRARLMSEWSRFCEMPKSASAEILPLRSKGL
jgi:integrase